MGSRHACMHASIHEFVCVCLFACMHMCVRSWVSFFVYACVYAYVGACLQMNKCMCEYI